VFRDYLYCETKLVIKTQELYRFGSRYKYVVMLTSKEEMIAIYLANIYTLLFINKSYKDDNRCSMCVHQSRVAARWSLRCELDGFSYLTLIPHAFLYLIIM